MDTICYTGIGARKSGKHTKKQYLDVMNKNFTRSCATYTKTLKCKSCKKMRSMISGLLKKSIKASKKKKTYKMSKKSSSKLRNTAYNCKKCQNNKPKQCDLDDYILFSGAVKGECDKM